MFNRADHFGQINRWAEKRRLGRAAAPHRILAAIDLTAGDSLNIEILRQARQLASLQPALITVMSVLAVENRHGLGRQGSRDRERADSEKRASRSPPCCSQAGPPTAPVGVNVVTGNDPVGAITQCVEDYGIDLVRDRLLPKNPFANFIHARPGTRS